MKLQEAVICKRLLGRTPSFARTFRFQRTFLLSTSLVVSIVVLGDVGTLNPSVSAQSKASQPLTFEVASVKPGNSESVDYNRYQSGGRYSAHLSVRNLIGVAYRDEFDAGHLSGGPDWVNTTRFDVEAKAPAGVVSAGKLEKQDTDKLDLMLRALLAERFKVRLRLETRTGTVYSLVVAKNGPKLPPAKTVTECKVPTEELSTMCHVFLRFGPREMIAQSVDLNDIIRALGTRLSSPVEDNTGLKGLYDLSLHWKPGPENRTQREEGAEIDSNDPDLFTALQEQLGLKLESRKAFVRHLIIEDAQKPSEN